MIPEEDKATEPEGFSEWMESFLRNEEDVFHDLKTAITYPNRKRPVKEQEWAALRYYICRACRDAQLRAEQSPVTFHPKKPEGSTMRDKARRAKWEPEFQVRIGQLTFWQDDNRRCRPFKDSNPNELIGELALIIKAALAGLDVSYNGRPRIIWKRHLNVLNKTIASLVAATLDKKEYSPEEVQERLDFLVSKKPVTFRRPL